VGHVRDVNLQLVAAMGQATHIDRVVEIARRFAVDGHDRQRAEITAATERRGIHLLGNGARLGQYLLREGVRQMMLADDDLSIDADFTGTAKNFLDASGRRETGLGESRDFDVHYRAVQFCQTRSPEHGRVEPGPECEFLP
jgi:hypothetical protein